MLAERIRQEEERIKNKISELEKLNMADQEKIKELQNNHTSQVFSQNEVEMIEIESQIESLMAKIKMRETTISKLQKDNPIIQSVIVEELSTWANEVSVLEEQAEDKAKELEQLRERFLKGLLELSTMHKRSSQLRYMSNQYREKLSEVTLRKANLPDYRFDNLSPICYQIRGLLIHEGQVFK